MYLKNLLITATAKPAKVYLLNEHLESDELRTK